MSFQETQALPLEWFGGLDSSVPSNDLPPFSAVTADNCIFPESAVGSRPGFTAWATDTLPQTSGLNSVVPVRTKQSNAVGDYVILGHDDGTVRVVPTSGGAASTLVSPLQPVPVITTAGQYYQRAIACLSDSTGYGRFAFVVGDNIPFSFRFSPPGVPSLSVSGSGGAMTAGDHRIALSVTFVDGSDGPLGAAATATVVSGGSVAVTWAEGTIPMGLDVASVTIWATTAGDREVFRKVATVSALAMTYTLVAADETLQEYPLDDHRSRVRSPQAPALGVMYAGRVAYFGETHRSVAGWDLGGSQGTAFGFGKGIPATGTPGGWTVTAGSGVKVGFGVCFIYFDGAAATPGRLVNVGTLLNDLPGMVTKAASGWSGTFGLRIVYQKSANCSSGSLKYGVAGSVGGTLNTINLAGLTPLVNYTTEATFTGTFSDDLKLTFEAVGPGVNGESIAIVALEAYDPTNTSHRSTIWWSRPYEARAIDTKYGAQTFGADDSDTVWTGWEWQGRFYVAKEGSVWVTQKTDGEPIDWPLERVSDLAGCCGRRAVGHGPDFKVLVNRTGCWLFQGAGVGPDANLSKEIPAEWAAINWSQAWQIWVAVDEVERRVYLGVPTGSSTYCDKLYVLDYMGGFGPATKNSGRRWSVWPIEARGGAVGLRAGAVARDLWISQTAGPVSTLGRLDKTVTTDWTTGTIPWTYETGRMGSDDGSLGLFRRLTLVCEGYGLITAAIVKSDGTLKTLPAPTLYAPMRGTQHLLFALKDERIGVRLATAGAGAKILLHRLSVWMRRNPFGDYRPRNP